MSSIFTISSERKVVLQNAIANLLIDWTWKYLPERWKSEERLFEMRDILEHLGYLSLEELSPSELGEFQAACREAHGAYFKTVTTRASEPEIVRVLNAWDEVLLAISQDMRLTQ